MNISAENAYDVISTTQSSSGGISETYEALFDDIERILCHTRETSLGQEATKLLESLYDVYRDRREPNWDGYDAEPIREGVYFEAMKLVERFPVGIPLPEIIAEPNGNIGFEWYKDPHHLFVASVGGNNTIRYAGIFGKGSESFGSENFGETIPHTIMRNINRVYL